MNTTALHTIDPATLTTRDLDALVARGRRERSAAAHTLISGLGRALTRLVARTNAATARDGAFDRFASPAQGR